MAQPSPARNFASILCARSLELCERLRCLDLGPYPRALEPDHHPATAARDLLGDAEQPVRHRALAAREVHRAAPDALPFREADQLVDEAALLALDLRPRRQRACLDAEHRRHLSVRGFVRVLVAHRVDQRVELVVEADHRRAQALLDDPLDRLDARWDALDLVAAKHSELRRRIHAQARRGDLAERALAAADQLRPVRTAQRARRTIGLDDLAAPSHDREAGDPILDLAVLRRQLPCRARREPAADRRAVDRRRKVAERVAAPLELALEPLAVQPRLDIAHELGRRHRAQRLHPLHVARDAAEQRHRAAAHARATAVRDARDPVLARELDDRDDLAHVLGPHHRVRPRARADAIAIRDQQARPRIARVRIEIDGARRIATRPEDRLEVALQAIDVRYGVHAETVPSMVAP